MTASLHTLLDVALRTSVVYFFVLLGLRFGGTRTLGQMTVFDFVLLLIISNAVQNAMVGPDTSLVGGLVAAAVLMSWHWLINMARLRNRRLAKLISGEGIMLIYHGKILAPASRATSCCRRSGSTAWRGPMTCCSRCSSPMARSVWCETTTSGRASGRITGSRA